MLSLENPPKLLVSVLRLGMGVLKPIILGCVEGQLNAPSFYRMLRNRRESSRYERELLDAVQAKGRPDLVRRVCLAVLARRRGPRFRRALIEAERTLGLRS